MALKIETTIRNMYAECLDGLDDDEIELLQGLEDYDIPVEVTGQETDGYFNVTTPSGREIVGLSWVHLDGFQYEGPML